MTPNLSEDKSSHRMPVAERRVALVAAALRVVAAHGVAGATTRAIVAEAGMALASFHYAFSSRDELMTELVNHVIAHEQTALAPPMPHVADNLRGVIRDGLQRYFDHLVEEPEQEQAMLELTQYALRTPALKSLACRQYDRYFSLAEDSLTLAAELTGASWRIPAPQIATLLVAFTDGLTIGWLVNRDDQAAASLMDIAADSIALLAEVAP